jgi:prepilin-type N-terminal cleavage/methylation domain-containing protein
MPVTPSQQTLRTRTLRTRTLRTRTQRTRGFSLVELVIAMGLLAIIMMPIIALMATSYKVYNASSTSRDGTYVRQVALDAAAIRLSATNRVLGAGTNYVDVRTAAGTTARLSYTGGTLVWRENGVNQVLVQDLSNARFSVGAAAGATATAGELILLEVGSRRPGEPVETWSSTRLWIKPTI